MRLDPASFHSHLERVKFALYNKGSLKDIPDWIEKNTFIRLGEPYSYLGHEFQKYIISLEDEEVNVQKCSQVGLSEIMARWVMAVAYNYTSFKTIVTFPFSGDAVNFARTRVDPFIASSPALRAAMSPDVNNGEQKMVKESIVHFRGTNGLTAAISIPADCIVSDEIDRSNPGILTQYTSRLTHSPYKWRRNFSTPTVKGMGIAKLMETSKRHVKMVKCHCCNHWFLPDFFEHVRIPGYSGALAELTKNTIAKTRYLEAQLFCPRCDSVPDLSEPYRNYVIENNESNFSAAGVMVSPFDAPAFITPVTLLQAMVGYSNLTEFINQNLGKTSENSDEALTLEDVVNSETTTSLEDSSVHCMGGDMGVICHIMVGRKTLDGTLLVVHREKVHIGEFEKRRLELKSKYKVTVSVFDSMPYTDLIMRLQRADKNLFGAVYVQTKKVELHSVAMFDGDTSGGKMPIHQVKINRDPSLDNLMTKFKRGEVKMQLSGTDLDEEVQKHLLEMKRMKVFDQAGDFRFSWVKPDAAVDHFHHALHYLNTACDLRGTLMRDGQQTPIQGVPFVKLHRLPVIQRNPVTQVVKQ